ncbi:MAG: homoserine O-acetyltransferase [Bacteroidetes bacterium]|nr:homoserine O-acetyltransferase [Bacteroidota bacterium]
MLAWRAHIDPDTRFWTHPGPFKLECGAVLPHVQVAYRTWGRLAEGCANAVLVCHALTGSADADRWWAGLIGPGRALDVERDYIVCSNVLGSCYGTTGPLSPRAKGRDPWGPDFPPITIRDMVRLQAVLLEHLGVRRLRLVVGGSMGGMQALEWALLYPERVEAVAAIAVSGRHSAWCIAISEAQRQAIYADPRWQGGRYYPGPGPEVGLSAARMMAMCLYRSPESFALRFGRNLQPEADCFAVESYLRYQGRKLVHRFDANSYVLLTRAMDSHDLARSRGPYEAVLRSIAHPTLVVSIPTDRLYVPEEQRELARLIPNARLVELDSPHGHDAFLIETERLGALLARFRAELGHWACRRTG